jgi:HEAT repeat protein
MQQRESELLKALKIADKQNRLTAIRDLAPFSFDDKVRAALEEVLLSDPAPELRKQVAVSFGKTANKDAVPALEIAKAKDSDRTVRQAAYRAIIMIQGY